MTSGRIIKAMSGFYYVKPDSGEKPDTPPKSSDGTYQCRARGLFRKKKISPLVGDRVLFEVTDTDDVEGNVVEIQDRKNALTRPQVANVDQALVIFAVHTPEPALDLLDRFLIEMRRQGIEVILVFNKDDLGGPEELDRFKRIYKGADVGILFTSVVNDTGIDSLKELLKGKITTVAGPSGAGKSSIINALSGKEVMMTGEVSRKIGRGKQTTRHVELVEVQEDSYIIDTPGFSSLELSGIESSDLDLYFPEIGKYKNICYYSGCSHISEPDCKVKQMLSEGEIPEERYESYRLFYEEISKRRRYQ